MAADAGKKFNCNGSKQSEKDIENTLVESASEELTESNKLSVLDRDNFEKQLKEFGLLGKDLANPDQANKLQQAKIADYLLIIKLEDFKSSVNTETIELTGEKNSSTSANMKVSWRMIESATMEIVASGSKKVSFSASYAAACTNVVDNLVDKMDGVISESILKKIK